jgi:hypothetical protein
MELTNLDLSPLLKKLLVEYCSSLYEQDAILDDYHLIIEFNSLVEDNKLYDLFENEYQTNWIRREFI